MGKKKIRPKPVPIPVTGTLQKRSLSIALNTPRDGEGTFEPRLIKKNQTRVTQMNGQILSLYAKGMTTREIVATFKEMYDADVSGYLDNPPIMGPR